ncbi:hypothetical protein LINGRAHAP2_LOCUS1986, partial [Linum grandiflorum]
SSSHKEREREQPWQLGRREGEEEGIAGSAWVRFEARNDRISFLRGRRLDSGGSRVGNGSSIEMGGRRNPRRIMGFGHRRRGYSPEKKKDQSAITKSSRTNLQ